jgi:redox-sensing transcriptional repressor
MHEGTTFLMMAAEHPPGGSAGEGTDGTSGDRPDPSVPRGIPDATVARLPLYHRALMGQHQLGVGTVSSEQLAEMAGVNAAKVRKDLSYFGSYGTRGVGYDVDQLLGEIRRELGLDRAWSCLVVGVGNLGSALLSFAGFRERGFHVTAAVDVDPQRVGTRVGGLEVAHQNEMAHLIAEHAIAIGVIATPPAAAQEVADALVAAGVEAILNFAPTMVEVPEGVLIRHVDLASELEILAFHKGRRDAPLDRTAAG